MRLRHALPLPSTLPLSAGSWLGSWLGSGPTSRGRQVAVLRFHAASAGHVTKAAYSHMEGMYVRYGTNTSERQRSAELPRTPLWRSWLCGRFGARSNGYTSDIVLLGKSEGFVEVHQRSEIRINMPVLHGTYSLQLARTSLYWCTTGVLVAPCRIRICNRRVKSPSRRVRQRTPKYIIPPE